MPYRSQIGRKPNLLTIKTSTFTSTEDKMNDLIFNINLGEFQPLNHCD